MNMISIYNILHSNDATTMKQGELVYCTIIPKVKKYISRNEKFYIDFTNIENINTLFLTGWISKLFIDNNLKGIKELIRFVGLSNKAQIKTLRHSLTNTIALSKIYR